MYMCIYIYVWFHQQSQGFLANCPIIHFWTANHPVGGFNPSETC